MDFSLGSSSLARKTGVGVLSRGVGDFGLRWRCTFAGLLGRGICGDSVSGLGVLFLRLPTENINITEFSVLENKLNYSSNNLKCHTISVNLIIMIIQNSLQHILIYAHAEKLQYH